MQKQDDWTLVNLVRQRAERYGDREFVSWEGRESLSFAALDARSSRLAGAMRAAGVEAGDRVLMLVGNRIEFLLCMFAAVKLGAWFVPVNTELKGDFLAHQLRNADPRLVVADAALLPAFEGIAHDDAEPSLVVVTAGDPPEQVPEVFAGAHIEHFARFEADAPDTGFAPVAVQPHDIAAIMYTSGTTGPAKGVLMPHAHLYLFAVGVQQALAPGEDDVYYVAMPLFHANGLFMQVLASLYGGSRVYLVERFSPNRWLDEVIASGATLTNALGVMPEFIYNTPESPRDRDHKLRAVMAVPIGREWGEGFQRRFGVKIVQGFGMTECNMPVYGRLDETALIPGCAGYVLEEFFEIAIGNPETDDLLPVGEVGEILIRPRVAGCFSAGYYRMPERTVEAWRNLWFHTGDAARFDEEGRLHYIDRIKDCIRRRGENISAYEVEQVINQHPQVAESAVIGVKVAGAGGEEEVMAVVVPEGGAIVDPASLLDFCVPRMPRFAVPRFVELANTLDKTASGKLRKQDLRDAGPGPRTWDRETAGYKLPRRS